MAEYAHIGWPTGANAPQTIIPEKKWQIRRKKMTIMLPIIMFLLKKRPMPKMVKARM